VGRAPVPGLPGSSSVPGFPNMFSILGPYGFNGASYFNLIEVQARHIVRCLARARRERATRVQVNRGRERPLLGQDAAPPAPAGVLPTGLRHLEPATTSTSHGDVPFRAALTLETMWDSATFDLADYNLRRPAGRPSECRGGCPMRAVSCHDSKLESSTCPPR